MTPAPVGHGAERARRFAQDPAVLSRTTGRQTLLCTRDEPEPFVLDDTAQAAWQAFRAPRTVAEVAGDLASSFRADPAVVARDLEPVVADLVARGALVAVS